MRQAEGLRASLNPLQHPLGASLLLCCNALLTQCCLMLCMILFKDNNYRVRTALI